jgi:hypothetical protein
MGVSGEHQNVKCRSAWLVGDEQNSGFTLFGKPWDADYVRSLWDEQGDHLRFDGRPGMNSPEMKETAN